MAAPFSIPTFADGRGSLSVLDGILPFPVRRVYYVYGVPPGAARGGHGHRRTAQALVCLAGRCEVHVEARGARSVHPLSSPGRGLLLDPSDWHVLGGFSEGAVLLVLASEPYDPGDYLPAPLA